jgi:TPP-dependent trihydroxycyclohexane-1,2-dione (THcHDO) dehydratase
VDSVRITMAQAVAAFLKSQYVERDGRYEHGHRRGHGHHQAEAWDCPVAEVSKVAVVQAARENNEEAVKRERYFL